LRDISGKIYGKWFYIVSFLPFRLPWLAANESTPARMVRAGFLEKREGAFLNAKDKV
jgi:hypothetical protein